MDSLIRNMKTKYNIDGFIQINIKNTKNVTTKYRTAPIIMMAGSLNEKILLVFERYFPRRYISTETNKTITIAKSE